MLQKKKIFLIIAIVFIALIARLYKLNEVPIELFGDEIDVGLQAYSLLTTGKDYFGNSFPIMFQSFEERRLPVFIYSAVPFVGIFGLNEWGVRLTGVFWGILGIVGIFLLGQKLYNYKVGLASAFLLAISPWHLQYSRQAGIEAGLLLTFIIFALWSFLKGLDDFKWLLVSVVLFGISFYTYAISSLFTAIFAIVLLLLNYKKIFKYKASKIAFTAVIGILILLPFAILTFQGKATERSSKISVLNDKELNDDIVTRRNIEKNDTSAKIWHNKVWTFSDKILANYFNAFSSNFLFFVGDPNLRHSYDKGLLYLFQLLLIIFGIIYLVKEKKNPSLVIALLLIAPIPSVITIDGGYHASRLIILLLPLTLISALGSIYLLDNYKIPKYKLIASVIILLCMINVTYYLHRYYNDWSRDSWRFWQSGYKEAITYIKRVDQDYSKIYFNNTYETTLPRFLFWYEYNMSDFQKEFHKVPDNEKIGDVFNGYKFNEKYFFGKIDRNDTYGGLDQLLKPGELYLISRIDEAQGADWRVSPPGNIKVLKTIVNPFDKPIFYVVTKI